MPQHVHAVLPVDAVALLTTGPRQRVRRQITLAKHLYSLMAAANAYQQLGHLAVRHPTDRGPQGPRPALTLDDRDDLLGLIRARPCDDEQPLGKRRHDADLLQRRVPDVIDPVLVDRPVIGVTGHAEEQPRGVRLPIRALPRQRHRDRRKLFHVRFQGPLHPVR
ncbi:hypothetical protein ACQEVF_44295 [Nonomuraea polychroma]|uniref:hypothetical protein n=1 Tax=Nonomuraea polychroma TaxID=46176 RepID=UPI003D8CAF67